MIPDIVLILKPTTASSFSVVSRLREKRPGKECAEFARPWRRADSPFTGVPERAAGKRAFRKTGL